MHKMGQKRWLNIVAMVLAAGCNGLSFAQSGATRLPNDPAEYLRLVAEANGISDPAPQPWHMQVSYKAFNEDGTVKDQGRFEEYWVSPAKFKQSYTSKEFNQTNYGTDKGMMQAGDKKWPSYPVGFARSAFVTPVPNRYVFGLMDLESKLQDVNGMSYLCILIKDKPRTPDEVVKANESHCFDGADHAYNFTFNQQVPTVLTFSNARQFGHKAVPGDIAVQHGGKLTFTAHLESLEELKAVDDAIFTPPADSAPVRATKIPKLSQMPSAAEPKTSIYSVNGKVMEAQIITKVPPTYPAIAKAAHVTGDVVVKTVIGKDGHAEELEVLSGPPMLRQAALDAVKQWVFKPYQLNGAAIEVSTVIRITFELTNPSATLPAKP